MEQMPMPVLSKEVETEFAMSSVMLNVMLMPTMARAVQNGDPVPEDLRHEINKTIGKVVARSPQIMAELIRREDRIKELEAQVASMLLSDKEK